MRLCDCGCGTSLQGMRRQARYLNHAHRQRAYDRQKASETGDPTQAPGHAPLTVSGASTAAQMTPAQMRRRLDQLAREFDRAGSTTAMRQEGRALAKALGLPGPCWLPFDACGSA